jgi:tRNA pseudouridine38-40 synthase
VPRYKLTIAYDGTEFCGWQKQEPPVGTNAAPHKVLDGSSLADSLTAPPAQNRLTLRTVQEIAERAVREVVRQPITLQGASRTDSGVHARGQVAAFTCSDDPQSGWPLSRGTDSLLRAINSRLPDDVLILAAETTGDDFNPISGATSKAYSYTLHVSPHRPIWDRRYVHHVWMPLDVARMNEAAALLVGEHDFAAFAAAGHGRLSTIRTVFDCRVTELPGPHSTLHTPDSTLPPDRRLRIEISGNGFLWNMVRIIAGTLVEAGRGRLAPEDIRGALATGDRRKAGPTLPPTGLCLEWIKYT